MAYTESFFEVSSQLIPVLFLAMIVEEKLQSAGDDSPFERVARSWLFTLLVIGEALALAVVAGGLRATKGTGNLVASSLLFATFLMALPAIERELTNERRPLERLGHALAGVTLIGAALWAIVAMQVS